MKYNDEDIKKSYKDYMDNINKPDINSKLIWNNYEKNNDKRKIISKEYPYFSVLEKVATVILVFIIIGGISLSYFLDKKNETDKNEINSNENNIIEQQINIEYKEIEDYYEVSKQYQSEGYLQENNKVWKWKDDNLLIYKDGEVLWTIPAEKKQYLITREEYPDGKTITFYYAEYEGEVYVRQPYMYMSAPEDILVTTDGKNVYLLFGEFDSITHEGFTCQKPYILNMETGEYTEILSGLEIEGKNYTEYEMYRDWEFYGDYAYVYIREENDHDHTIPDKKYKINLKTETSKPSESTVSDNYTKEFDVVRKNENYYLINTITDEQLIRLEPEIAERINGLYINEDKSKILIFVDDDKNEIARMAMIDTSNYEIEYFSSKLNRGTWLLLDNNLCYQSADVYTVYKEIKNKSEELPEYSKNIDKLSVFDNNEEKFSTDKFIIKELFDKDLEYRELSNYENPTEDSIIINGYSKEEKVLFISVSKDNIIGIKDYRNDKGITWYETNKFRDYAAFKKRIISENANGYYTWYYDITHDGLKDKILVNTRTLYDMQEESKDTISIYSGRSYELIWTKNINSSHMGEGSIRIYNDGEKDYLLMWKPYMAQGDAVYRCKVVKLSEDGIEEIIDEKVFSYSLNSLSVDTEALREYGAEVNKYLEKSFVLAESGSIMGEGHSTDKKKRITTYDVEADIKSIEEELDSMQ